VKETGREHRREIERFRRNLAEELDAACLYEAIAASEQDEEKASIFRELAETERAHAAVWAQKLEDAGAPAPPHRVGLRTRLLSALARRGGAATVLPIMRSIEDGAEAGYAGQPDAKALGMDRQEQSHARVFSALSAQDGRASIASVETWHRGSRGGSLRAAVFGANDGLVSNFSLIMGVAGAAPGQGVILLTGMAGMLAGAFSMAAGEYVSVRSQRELFEHEIRKERDELESSPEEERKELELIYRAKGIPREQAAELARSIIASPGSALDTLAREELGLDPSELGSPWTAAFSSFFAFVGGAVIPLVPFFFLEGAHGVASSAGLSALALFAVGALIALFTGKGALYGGFRMAAIGGAVALVTNTLGRLIGVSLG
jgi:VIT1/CCC1 family predicted Fe2+/Mn2+ transporter